VMSRLLVRRLARNETLQMVSPELCKNSFSATTPSKDVR
jgi:hypothetical protein